MSPEEQERFDEFIAPILRLPLRQQYNALLTFIAELMEEMDTATIVRIRDEMLKCNELENARPCEEDVTAGLRTLIDGHLALRELRGQQTE